MAQRKGKEPRRTAGTTGEAGQPSGLLYRRAVVKVGTNLLTGGADRLDLEMMASLVGQLVRLHQQGVELILVTSGAVAAGRRELAVWLAGGGSAQKGDGAPPRRDTAFRQVLAAIGQSKLMHAYEQLFAWSGIPVAQALLTRRDIHDRLGYLNIRNTLLALLGLRVIPIVNENDVVAAEELEGDAFGDNDTLSALVATIVDADLLLLLGDVAGLFTADPHTHADARLIPRVERVDASIEALAGESYGGKGRGGMRTKLEAARLVAASGIATVIADGREPNALVRLLGGEAIGTHFAPTSSRLESRRRWMLSVISPTGAIIADAGAVKALREQNRSLLPAGVRGAQREFGRGEVVPILGPDGERVAVGITNYGVEDIGRIAGLRSDQILEVLGHQYGAEVVHRNNLVLL